MINDFDIYKTIYRQKVGDEKQWRRFEIENFNSNFIKCTSLFNMKSHFTKSAKRSFNFKPPKSVQVEAATGKMLLEMWEKKVLDAWEGTWITKSLRLCANTKKKEASSTPTWYFCPAAKIIKYRECFPAIYPQNGSRNREVGEEFDRALCVFNVHRFSVCDYNYLI